MSKLAKLVASIFLEPSFRCVPCRAAHALLCVACLSADREENRAPTNVPGSHVTTTATGISGRSDFAAAEHPVHSFGESRGLVDGVRGYLLLL
jgi:hypothetical protein